jgi:hypothetical protein
MSDPTKQTPMQPNEPVVCDCCELDTPRDLASPLNNAYGLNRGWRCRMCNEHQGQQLKMAQDHEDEVRKRWDETVDLWHAAEDRADKYKEKMLAAFRSRESVLRQFDRLTDFHHATPHGCSCGEEDCAELDVIGADWITDLISRMNRR